MTVSSSPSGIPSPARLEGWLRDRGYPVARQHQTVGQGFEREGLAVPALIARAHQVLDAGL